jgi:hypothetical protein
MTGFWPVTWHTLRLFGLAQDMLGASKSPGSSSGQRKICASRENEVKLRNSDCGLRISCLLRPQRLGGEISEFVHRKDTEFAKDLGR